MIWLEPLDVVDDNDDVDDDDDDSSSTSQKVPSEVAKKKFSTVSCPKCAGFESWGKLCFLGIVVNLFLLDTGLSDERDIEWRILVSYHCHCELYEPRNENT